jgi:hypothetical protein
MSKSRAKGTAAETAVVTYLQQHGFEYAERRAMNGVNDRGDIAGIPGVCLEVKNCARMDLAGWVDEARLEAGNAGVSVYAVVHKRRGKGDPGDWYVTLPLSVFCQVIE